MATTDFIAAIELGSSKITGIAGRKNQDGSIEVLAYAHQPAADFVRKGAVYNIDKAASAVKTIKQQLEEQLHGPTIARVYTSISGQSLHSVKNAIPHILDEESTITQEIVDEINDKNREMSVTPGMDVPDVAPQEYSIDKRLHADPVGVMGREIIGQFLNLLVRASVKKNLIQSFEQAGVEITDLFVSPVVEARAVLTDGEMRSGCALIDLGADITTVAVYKNNMLRYLCVIPLGGNNITRDIAEQRMEEDVAEALKLQYANVIYEENPEAKPYATGNGNTIAPELLYDIVEARQEEILRNAWNQIDKSGYADKLLSGVVLTGGGANLPGTEELFRQLSKTNKTRTANFVRLNIKTTGTELPKDGTLNVLLGLLNEGNENCAGEQAKEPLKPGDMADMFADDPTLHKPDNPQPEEGKTHNEPAAKKEDAPADKDKKPGQTEASNPTKEQKKKGTSFGQKLRDFFSSDDSSVI